MSKAIHLTNETHAMAKAFCEANGISIRGWVDSLIQSGAADLRGTILPVEDPWWDDHMPNGWGCKCVGQITRRVADRKGGAVAELKARHEVAEAALVRQTLERNDWRLKKSAVDLGVFPQTLRRMIERHGMWDDYCALGHMQGRPPKDAT